MKSVNNTTDIGCSNIHDISTCYIFRDLPVCKYREWRERGGGAYLYCHKLGAFVSDLLMKQKEKSNEVSRE